MKVLLLADGIVGQKITEFLLADFPGDLTSVITVTENEISKLARSRGIPSKILNTSADSFASSGPYDLGVLAWWPTIIREPLLSLPRRGFINTHPSFLPYNRGKHYNFWALVEEAPFGVSLHWVTAEIDSGSIIAQKKIPYDWCDTGESLYNKAQTSMVELFAEIYPQMRVQDLKEIPQNLNAGSFHRSFELENASCIDLQRQYSARDLLNLLRARTFVGHPACWFEEDGKRYEITVTIKRIDRT